MATALSIYIALKAEYLKTSNPVKVSDLAKLVGTNTKRVNEVVNFDSRIERTEVEVAYRTPSYNWVYKQAPAVQLSRRHLIQLIAIVEADHV